MKKCEEINISEMVENAKQDLDNVTIQSDVKIEVI